MRAVIISRVVQKFSSCPVPVVVGASLFYGLRASLLALAFAACAAVSASAQTPVATVNGSTISVEDLSLALSDLANQGVPQNELISRAPDVLRELIIERLIEDAYARNTVRTARGEEISSDFALRRADRARRRVLADAYFRANLVPTPVSQEDVDRYVRDNPDFFRTRKTYHFSEMSIAQPNDPLKDRLVKEIGEISNLRNVRPQRIELLIDWLNANKISFSHSKQWRGSEQVPRAFLDRLKQLDNQPGKVGVAEANGLMNVVVLYGSYDDPANPAHMQQSIISQVLSRQAREDHIKSVGDDLIAGAKVEIFEDTIAEALARPGAHGPPARVASATQKTLWTTQLALLFLAPFAGLVFYRRDHIAAGLTMHDTPGRHFSHSAEARRFVVGAFAVLILGGAAYLFHASGAATFSRDVMITAMAALCIAAALVLLLWKAPGLSIATRSRWAALGVLSGVQALILAFA